MQIGRLEKLLEGEREKKKKTFSLYLLWFVWFILILETEAWRDCPLPKEDGFLCTRRGGGGGRRRGGMVLCHGAVSLLFIWIHCKSTVNTCTVKTEESKRKVIVCMSECVGVGVSHFFYFFNNKLISVIYVHTYPCLSSFLTSMPQS